MSLVDKFLTLPKSPMKQLFQLPPWLLGYQKKWLSGDITAGLIVTVMLIPQSLAYALLAGLPPQVGLYASILPLLAYALFGSSMTLAVGPVAVASLMTASALTPLAASGSPEYVVLAMQLAMLSGVMLFGFGLLRLGFLAHLLSHPVISGFISGSAVLIALGQLKHLLGLKTSAHGVFGTLHELWQQLPNSNLATCGIGAGALACLIFARQSLPSLLVKFGSQKSHAELLAKLAPMAVVVVSILLVSLFDLTHAGVKVVGYVPAGLPSLHWVWPDHAALSALWLPALVISLVGFVESVSVGQSLALKRQQRIAPNLELLGLGAANLSSALSGGYPVTGGFARSVVNFSAGANTPLAGIISACLMSVALIAFTGFFTNLPQAVLAATIIVAVLGMLDNHTLREAWHYDRADAYALIATALGVIFIGVEEGILTGVVLSFGVFAWRSSRPHSAVIGRVPGTQHFRNVARYEVETIPQVLALRIDENLFFGNAHAIEDTLTTHLAQDTSLTDIVLVLSSTNRIDSTALDVLSKLNRGLREQHKRLHLAEVKGPVMDQLKHARLLNDLSGQIFLSTHEAFNQLSTRHS